MTTSLDLLKDTLTIAPETYKDNVRIITGLDDKAQKMGTIAGVFLGVFFALVKPDQLLNLVSLIGGTGIWVVTSVTLLLIACIGLCLWCMWTKVIPPPLSLGHLAFIFKNTGGKDLDEGVYYRERIAIWTECVTAQGQVSAAKQKRVLGAQIALAVAMFLIAGMLLYLIHSVHPIPAPGSTVSVGNC